MKFLSESREISFGSTLKKAYVIIFIIFVLLIIAGFIIRGFTTWIPEPDWADPIYDDYQYLMMWLASLSILFQNIGIALFSLATFLGAITDRDLTKQVRTGLAIASGLAIVALIIFGASFQIVYLI